MNGECSRRLGETLLCCLVLGFCCLVLGFWGLGSASAAEKRTQLPDWSGWWTLDRRINDEWKQNPPPMKAEDLARFRAARSADSDPDPGRFCRPPQFTGYSGGFTEAVEFLFTPGRVTLINEGGLIRRIYTDGRSLPTAHENSNTGTSIGHWEGQTLVVETVDINPGALYPLYTTHGAMSIGRNVRITERIALQAPDKLQFDIVTLAPDLFLKPDRRERIYTRVPNKKTANEFTPCVEHDRSIDSTTGKQRFDLTPPADLPPPPPKTP
jgi:hypothetical protein